MTALKFHFTNLGGVSFWSSVKCLVSHFIKCAISPILSINKHICSLHTRLVLHWFLHKINPQLFSCIVSDLAHVQEFSQIFDLFQKIFFKLSHTAKSHSKCLCNVYKLSQGCVPHLRFVSRDPGQFLRLNNNWIFFAYSGKCRDEIKYKNIGKFDWRIVVDSYFLSIFIYRMSH